jgi:drug/metabolite transporter (DMT)-like permease
MHHIKTFFQMHPRLLAWLVLALPMLVVMLLASRDVPLQPLQRLALAGVTVLLAGACVWIVYWE